MKKKESALLQKRNQDIISDYKKLKKSEEINNNRYIFKTLSEKYYLESNTLYRIISADKRAF